MKIQCQDCGEIITGRDELDAEVKWGKHECLNERDTDKLSLTELRRLAYEAAGDPLPESE